MFSLSLRTILLFAALFNPACRLWQTKTEDAPAAPAVAAVEPIKSRIPFATKEPENYQTEIVVTANNKETKMFTARRGAARLTIYEYQTPNEFAVLQTAAGNSFLINRGQKIYVENQMTNGGDVADDDEIFPTAELVNQQESAVFESLPAENGQAKYLVTLAAASNSEIVVTIDEAINLPVKQEFFSVSGDQKTLQTTTELKNFTTQIDANNFELPKDYRKVTPADFQRITRQTK